MTGPIALHGGGEFLPGDEPFLAALLALARTGGVGQLVGDRPIQVAIVPTAAARGRPEIAAAHGVAAFERVARDRGLLVQVEPVLVVDQASAGDAGFAARLAACALIYLPGGDPGLIPTLFPGSAAWTAILSAHSSGAVVAGASAGAMGLAAWTWTRDGVIAGLGLVPGVLVAPHADAGSWDRFVARFGHQRPAGVGVLGLGERTGAISEGGEDWRVVGPGEARWLPGKARDPAATIVAHDGQTLAIGADSP